MLTSSCVSFIFFSTNPRRVSRNRDIIFRADFDFALNETSWSTEGSSELGKAENLIGGAFGYTAVRSVKIQSCVATVTQGPMNEPPNAENFD